MENLAAYLADFSQFLNQSIENTWETSTNKAYQTALVLQSEVVSKKMIGIGHYAYERLMFKEGEVEDLLEEHIISFQWAEQAKSFLLLWRNILFEQQKATLLLTEGKVTTKDVEQLKIQSKAKILNVATDLKNYLDTAIKEIKTSKNGVKSQLESWKLQQNPWLTYQQQIEAIPQQCNQLEQDYEKLVETAQTFATIRDLAAKTMKMVQKEMDEIQQVSNQTITFINEHVEEKAGRIASHLEDLETKFRIPNHIKSFSNRLDSLTQDLVQKIQVPVDTQDGLIQYKDINFQRTATQWLDSEVLPLFYEVEELAEHVSNSMKMSMVNIRNRAILISNEQKEDRQTATDKAIICQPLNAFLDKTIIWNKDLKKLFHLINLRLNSSFKVDAIYHPTQDFLSIPLQSTINQLRTNQDQYLSKFKSWFSRRTAFLYRLKKNVEAEENLSKSEKIARFIQTHRPAIDNPQYTSIFLTKGYVGESFWVGRTAELQHARQLVRQWKAGFRGAVILSGQRFSGKSLFGETVAYRHFSGKTIRLSPHTTINFQGRKFTTQYDLSTPLEFIKNYTLNSRPLVWIDDLELWSDPKHTLSENVRHLRNYINSYSGRIFFMVSMSNWLKDHLENIHGIENIFQAEINLDHMSSDEIRQAILIRHGATHKTLVNKDGEEVNPQQFKKMTSRIQKATRGNIGSSLNHWAAGTKRMGEDKVIHEGNFQYTLPDFITPDNALILSAIMMKKRSNEYRLRKLFGEPFKNKYDGVLQRMINIGLLTRHLDGWLEVNEVAVNEVGRLLDAHKYLKFEK